MATAITLSDRIGRWTGWRVNAVGAASFLVVAAWALVAIFAPWLTPHGVGEIVDFDYFGPISAKTPQIGRAHV